MNRTDELRFWEKRDKQLGFGEGERDREVDRLARISHY